MEKGPPKSAPVPSNPAPSAGPPNALFDNLSHCEHRHPLDGDPQTAKRQVSIWTRFYVFLAIAIPLLFLTAAVFFIAYFVDPMPAGVAVYVAIFPGDSPPQVDAKEWTSAAGKSSYIRTSTTMSGMTIRFGGLDRGFLTSTSQVYGTHNKAPTPQSTLVTETATIQQRQAWSTTTAHFTAEIHALLRQAVCARAAVAMPSKMQIVLGQEHHTTTSFSFKIQGRNAAHLEELELLARFQYISEPPSTATLTVPAQAAHRPVYVSSLGSKPQPVDLGFPRWLHVVLISLGAFFVLGWTVMLIRLCFRNGRKGGTTCDSDEAGSTTQPNTPRPHARTWWLDALPRYASRPPSYASRLSCIPHVGERTAEENVLDRERA